MTLKDADNLLGQWAAWCSNELSRLGAGRQAWQKDYRPDWQEESEESHIVPGNDYEMQAVDGALARLGLTDPRNLHILRARYKLRHSFNFMQLDSAKRAFIAEYESFSDKKIARRLTAMDCVA